MISVDVLNLMKIIYMFWCVIICFCSADVNKAVSSKQANCERFVFVLINCIFQANNCYNHEVGIQRRTLI